MQSTWYRVIGQTVERSEREGWFLGEGPPGWVAGILFLLVVGLVGYLYLRHGRSSKAQLAMWLCRTLAIALTILAILNWTRQKSIVELPELIVAVDVSQSSTIVDHYPPSQWLQRLPQRLDDFQLDEATRLNLAKLALLGASPRAIEDLYDHYRVRFYTIGDESRPLAADLIDQPDSIAKLAGVDEHSRLGDCIIDMVQQHASTNCAGVIVFSDGASTSGKSLATAGQQAFAMGIPIIYVGLGNDRRPPDYELSDLQFEEFAYVGDTVELSLKFSAYSFTGETAEIRVLSDRSAESQIVTIPIDSNNLQQRVNLPVEINDSGLHNLKIRVSPDGRETTKENNELDAVIRAVDRKPAVLIVSGYPHPEYRMLKETLVRSLSPDGETAFDVNTLLVDASPGYGKIDTTTINLFPTDLESLGQYDVVVLCDTPVVNGGSPVGLTMEELMLIRRYVDNLSGSLILIPGPRYLPRDYLGTPLDALLPFEDLAGAAAREGNFQIAPTRLASRFKPFETLSEISQSTTNPSASPRWVMGSQNTSPTAMVMALWTDGQNPVAQLTWQSIGSGTVVFQGTDESYRWRYRNQIDWFAGYWTGLVKYLARHRINRRSKIGQLSTSKLTYGEDETIEFKAEIYSASMVSEHPADLQIQIDSDTGETTELRLIRDRSFSPQLVYRGKISNLKPSRYLATFPSEFPTGSAITTNFEVVFRQREFLETRMQQAAMQTSAEVSQGRFFSVQQTAQMWKNLPPGNTTTLERMPAEPIWFDTIGSWLSVSSLFAATILFLLCVEWTIRRRLKMI